jgi:hypothetical protein
MISRRWKTVFIVYFYMLTVVIMPLIILGLTGDLSVSAVAAFMSGVLVAVLGESLLDQVDDGFARFRRSFRSLWNDTEDEDAGAVGRYIGMWVVALALLAWNMYFVGRPPIKEGTSDWVPLVPFFLTFMWAPFFRFIFTEYDPYA